MVRQQDALYRPDNFVFATSHQGTLPTLYFQDAAGNQGRLQTSSHGQTAFARIAPVEVHTARVFLPTAAVQTQFLQDFAATNGSREALERVKLSYVGCGWPKVGCYVVEVKFAGPEPDRRHTGIRSSTARVSSAQENDALQREVNETYRDMKAAGAERFSDW